MKTRTDKLILALALLLVAATAYAQELEPVLPWVQIVSPIAVINQFEAAVVSTSPTFVVHASYLDPTEDIWHYRYVLKRALLPDGYYADTRNDFITNRDFLLGFDDAEWTAWQTWPLGDDEVEIAFADLPIDEPDPNNPGLTRTVFYLFAVQIMTSDGVVSVSREYGGQVANFRVSDNVAPLLTVQHPLFGRFQGSGQNLQHAIDVLPGTIDEFYWTADASIYGNEIASYRWGWDITDPDDPNDPNWALPPGLSEAHRHTLPISFNSGVHTLTIRVVDDAGNLTRALFLLNIVPVPDLSDQLPLLLVDDVRDSNSNGWPSQGGIPLDRDEYRDAFWLDVVGGDGGIAGFEPARDIVDTEAEQLELRDVVNYRAVVWTSRWVSSPNSAIARDFRPLDTGYGPIDLRYVWLGAYQEQAGNLLLAGSRAANNFVPESPYMMPVIYASAEGDQFGMAYVGGRIMRVGFGVDEDGDPLYPRLHGHRDLGLAAFDIMSPNASYYPPNSVMLLRDKRRATCAAQKGLALDADFVADNMPGGAAFADTIWTETSIDWRDEDGAVADDLSVSYLWGNDEFYDHDLLGRDTPVEPQDCDGAPCVEPLLRSIARYDWNRGRHLAADPDDEWPQDYYSGGDILQYCGDLALTLDQTTALTNDEVTAFVTHKHEDQKPSQVGDVVMGFDPYRFDHAHMKEALRWVLGEHFGLTMNP